MFSHHGHWQNQLTGWRSSADPLGSVTMMFESEKEAVAFCEDNGFNFVIEGSKPYKRQHQEYADNFAYTGNPKVRLSFQRVSVCLMASIGTERRFLVDSVL